MTTFKELLAKVYGWRSGFEDGGVVKDDLWAVWEYDQFPFYLCAKLVRVDEDGYAEVEGYQGMRFKAVMLLHGNRGRQFKQYLTAARTMHTELQGSAEAAIRDSLCDGLSSMAGISARHRIGKNGIRHPIIGTLFMNGVEKIMAGDAPAHAFHPDLKEEPSK